LQSYNREGFLKHFWIFFLLILNSCCTTNFTKKRGLFWTFFAVLHKKLDIILERKKVRFAQLYAQLTD